MRIAILLTITTFLATTNLAQAQPAASKPTWVYGHDLKVRSGGQTDWDKAIKYGIEVNKDNNTNAFLAISQSGNIAVTSGSELGATKKADWIYAHDLRVRKSNEAQFSTNTMKIGLEVFKDSGSNQLLYVTEKAGITYGNIPATIANDQDPVWHHGLSLKVRGPSELEFSENTQKFGVECFKDGNTGRLIYISETGMIATADAPKEMPKPDAIKAPKPLYGLTLRVRKAEEVNFTDSTKKYGVEVFLDENSGSMVYMSETGSIAVVPAASNLKDKQGLSWKHAMTLKARPGGIADFAKAAKYGVEVFQDNNSSYMIYISETGSIAVLAK